MPIESVIKEEKKDFAYPCLKKSDVQIVLFTSPKTGFVVNNFNCSSPIGYYSTAWAEHQFAVFEGEITLSNKK